jgi:hypothetical protein
MSRRYRCLTIRLWKWSDFKPLGFDDPRCAHVSLERWKKSCIVVEILIAKKRAIF